MLFRRRLLGALSLLSLVLCGVTVVLWVRSYWVADRLTIRRAHYRQAGSNEEDAEMSPYRGRVTAYEIQFNRGSILLHMDRSVELLLFLGPENLREWKQDWPEGTLVMWNRDEAYPTVLAQFGVFGLANEHVVLDRWVFFFGTADSTGFSSFPTSYVTEASVPAWFVVTLFAIPFSVRLVRYARSHLRKKPGHCPACGYDVRATPRRCSECGWREVGADAK